MKISEIIETIKLAFDSMRTNKLRAFLASLGVVIGISFVILMGWVLTALDRALDETFDLIGADILYVDKWDWSGGQNWKLVRQRKSITLPQANELIERLQSVELAVPIAQQWRATIKHENESVMGIGIQGTYSDYAMAPGGNVLTGRFFNKTEEIYGANVAVIGFGVMNSLFQDQDPIGKRIKINGHNYYVIGVIVKRATLFVDHIDNQIYIPLKSFWGVFGRFGRSLSVVVKAGGEQNLDEARAETRGIMREIRNLSPWDEDDFSINETKAFESSIATLRLYVWGIGIGMTVLSFIVGIIGIMNIMYVSVAERTKEIGIRKAIGAPRRSILLQFIFESAALCFIGAIIAFIACSIFVYVLATVLPKFVPGTSFLTPIMPYQLLIIASIVSIFVGILAGLMPAIRASKLDPVDALRYE